MQPAEELTEKKLAEDFERIQREVAEQIREYEVLYPELLGPRAGEDEVVQQPIYTYEIHAIT